MFAASAKDKQCHSASEFMFVSAATTGFGGVESIGAVQEGLE